MVHFILRRLLGVCLVLVLVSFVTFLLLDQSPGDAALAAVGETATQAQLDQARQEMGLNLPVYVRYERFAVKALLHADLGQSLTYNRPVSDLLAERFRYTLLLSAVSMGITLVAGMGIGWIAARNQGSWLDLGLMSLSALGIALPGFWLALLLMMVFSVWLRWLPVNGAGTPAHLILPAACLSLPSSAAVARLARASFLDARRASYVVTAYAKGLRSYQVWGKHILPNSLIPIITLMGLHLGHILGGAFVIETIFGWPGLGRLVVQAIFDRDFPLITGAVLLLAGVYLILNLAVDLIQTALDPRARQGLG